MRTGGDIMGLHDGHRENMRRRFINGGLDGFADHETLELLLFYAIPRRDTNETAHRLLNRYGSIDGVFKAKTEELMQVDGIGESAAVFLKLVPEVCRKARMSSGQRDTILDSVDRIGSYLLDCFSGELNEVVYQLCLDRKGKLLSCRRIGEGRADSADLNVRKLVENALLSSASEVVLAHNHPSGIALPSQEDYATTWRVREALGTIGVALQDHIIVADGDFISMAQSGMLSD
jgi:DNA repair protein RadC